MPPTGELANQNIKDRYFGKNDPVAKKMMRMANERTTPLVPPADKTIRTLWVGGLDTKTSEADVRQKFSSFGELASVRVIGGKNCAFVTYTTRKGAEDAASKLQTGLSINGSRCKLAWGKKQASKKEAKTRGAPPGPPGMAAPPGMKMKGPAAVPPPPGMRKTYYPSMDPANMGARFDTTHQEN
uniref:RRM domain-containing protein n=2 Tax=Lotharella globosa TaxID=91324 RepID=A0A7S3ZAJ5_9EUKA